MTQTPQQTFLPWLQLARLGNLPTAWSNVLAGAWLASGCWLPAATLLGLLVCSTCLYVGGMILNDAFDYERDCRHAPHRPLPNGSISVRSAFLAGFGLLAFGLLAAAGADVWAGESQHAWRPIRWSSTVVAASLAIFILLYDWLLKQTPAAPPLMGLCRSVNLLLGLTMPSVAKELDEGGDTVFCSPNSCWIDGFAANEFLDLHIGPLWPALLLGVFVAGITWFARREAEAGQRATMLAGLIIISAALAGFIASPWLLELPVMKQLALTTFLCIVSSFVWFRFWQAWRQPGPATIGKAVITALTCIILLDASMVLLATPANPLPALLVACLLLPSSWIGRWIPGT